MESNLKWLVEFCNGHPLTLKLVVGLLNYYRDSKVVVDTLVNKGSSVIRDPRKKTQNRSTALDTCLISIHDCLSDFQKRLLQFVSNFPAGCMEGDFGIWSKVDDYHKDVAELERFFLIETELDSLGITRIYLHNPVRFFVRSYWKNTAYEEAASIQLEAAESMMIYLAVVNEKYFQNSEIVDDLVYGLHRVDLEMPNYIHSLRFTQGGVKHSDEKSGTPDKYLQVIMGIALGLGQYFFIRDMYKLGEEILQIGIDACERLEEYEQGGLLCQYHLQLQSKQYSTKNKLAITEKLMSFAEKSQDETTQARLAMSQGDLALKRYNFTEAFEYYSKAANYFREDANKHQMGKDVPDSVFRTGTYGLILVSLGRVYEEQQKPEEAIKYYNEALKYQLSVQDYTNLGVTHHQLGNCYASLQEYQLAISNYKYAIEYFASTEQGQHLGNALGELGRVAEDTMLYKDIAISFSLKPNSFRYALDCVKKDITIFLNQESLITDDFWSDGRLLFSKLLGIIKLASFHQTSSEIGQWSEKFIREVLNIQTVDDEYELLYHPPTPYHRGLLMLAILGSRTSKYQLARKITFEQLFEMCDICLGLDEIFDLDAWTSGPYHSLKWLASWLRYWTLYQEGLTAEELFDFFEKVASMESIDTFEDEEDEET